MDTAACAQRASINIREWILPMGLLQAEKPFWKHNSRATRHSDRAAPAAVPLLLARSNENAHHDWSQVALGEASQPGDAGGIVISSKAVWEPLVRQDVQIAPDGRSRPRLS